MSLSDKLREPALVVMTTVHCAVNPDTWFTGAGVNWATIGNTSHDARLDGNADGCEDEVGWTVKLPQPGPLVLTL